MFPIALITKIVETILGDVGKDLVSKSRSSKRRFARSLFSYYETVKDYRTHCTDLLSLLERERELVPSHRMTPGTAKNIQRISDEMTDVITTIVGQFEGEWSSRLRGELYGESPSKQAKKRFNVVELYDAQLAKLIDQANTMDTHIAYLASELSQLQVNWETQEILLLNPAEADISKIVELFEGRGRMINSNEIISQFQVLKFTEDEDFEIMRTLLSKNVEAIDKLVEGIANFMKVNFHLEDIL